MVSPNNTPASNLAEIRRGLQAYCRQGSVYELRALGVGPSSRRVIYGYYDDLERMAQNAASLSGRARGVYFTPNPVSDELVQRSPNGLREFKRGHNEAEGAAASGEKLTRDSDVVRRRWILLDFDPVRGNGIKDSPATDAEEEAAIKQAESVANWLSSKGWPGPIVVASGNGCQLSYPIDLPNDETSKLLLRRCLPAIASLFPNPAVKLDGSVYNASQIWKVPGTLSMKGSPTSDRSHRLARILRVPGTSGLVIGPQLEALAAILPVEDQSPPVSVDRAGYAGGYGDYATLDVVAWFNSHGDYGRSLGEGKHAVRCPGRQSTLRGVLLKTATRWCGRPLMGTGPVSTAPTTTV